MATVSMIPLARVRELPATSGRVRPYRLRLTVEAESFGERLTRLRLARGWYISDLAEASGVPTPTIKQSALHPGVTAQTVYRLAHALGVSMEYLLVGEP